MGVEGRGPGSFAQLRRQQLSCAPSCCRQSQTCSCYLCPVFQRSLQSLFCYEIYPFLNIGNLCKLLLKIHLNQQTQLQAGCCLQTIHRNKTWVQTGEAACQGHPHVGTEKGQGQGPLTARYSLALTLQCLSGHGPPARVAQGTHLQDLGQAHLSHCPCMPLPCSPP